MKKKINLIVLILMISDAVVFTGFGLIEPVFAIFVNEDLIGGSILAAGIASTIFFLTKSILQLPFSRYVDKYDHAWHSPHKHLSTKFLWLGMTLIAITPFLYFFSTHVYHIYLAQFLFGVGSALGYPTWLKLWELHLEKGSESFQWTLYSTVISISGAISATVGAGITQHLGFRVTFILVGIIALLGCGILLFLNKDIRTSRFPIVRKI